MEYNIDRATPFNVRKGDNYFIPSPDNIIFTKIKNITSNGFDFKKGRFSGHVDFNLMDGVVLQKKNNSVIVLIRNDDNFKDNYKILEKFLKEGYTPVPLEIVNPEIDIRKKV